MLIAYKLYLVKVRKCMQMKTKSFTRKKSHFLEWSWEAFYSLEQSKINFNTEALCFVEPLVIIKLLM